MDCNIHSLQQLAAVYQYKLRVARREFEQQRGLVEQSKAELTDVTAAVVRLEANLHDNATYMRVDEVCSNAVKMVFALKYKAQLEYDVDRESYFLELAEADVREQLQVLSDKRRLIEKFETKIKAVANIVKRVNRSIEVLEEISQEEDFEQTYYLRVAENV